MAFTDTFILSTQSTFVGRVQAALVTACGNIANEGLAVPNHPARVQLVHQILANPSNLANYTTLFAVTVAADTTVISDATQAGTVPLTTGNVQTQQALITDAHISNAVSAEFNSYCQGIPA
jgi:hypothetical protein